MRFGFIGASVCVACVATPVIARAQTRDAVGAEVLFREGRAAADAGRYAEACPKFEASYQLDATQGTLFNLADCEEKSGKLAEAWQHFRQLTEQLPANDDRRAYAQTHGVAIEARLPRLRVVLAANAPTGTTIDRDGVPLGDALVNVQLPMNAGTHHFVVHAPNHDDKPYDVTLADGEKRDLEVSAGPVRKTSSTTPTTTTSTASRTSSSSGSTSRAFGFVLGGVGLASAGVGAIFGALALTDNGASNASCNAGVCTDQHAVDLHERAKTEAIVSDITLFGGAAIFVAGAILVFTSPHAEVRVALAPRGFFIVGKFP